jgi:hypothetical protein
LATYAVAIFRINNFVKDFNSFYIALAPGSMSEMKPYLDEQRSRMLTTSS